MVYDILTGTVWLTCIPDGYGMSYNVPSRVIKRLSESVLIFLNVPSSGLCTFYVMFCKCIIV